MRERHSHWIAAALSVLLLDLSPARAQVCAPDQVQTSLHELRRLSLDLRGRLPDLEEQESVVTNGAIDPAIVSAMVRSEDAIAQLRALHRDRLWANVSDVRLANQSWTLQKPRQGPPDVYFLQGTGRGNAFRGGATNGCLDEPARFDATSGAILTTPDPANSAWRREGWVLVRPYWNPSIEVKVCAFDAQTAAQAQNAAGQMVRCDQAVVAGCGCGPNLNWCQSGPDGTVAAITGAFAEQALRFLDGVIRGNRPYSDIILAKDVEVNGPISHYFRYQTSGGANLIFVTSGQDMPMPVIPFTEPGTWQRIDRGDHHAGVLSLPLYLLKFQSNRGRANRFYNAFLCQYFQAPPGGLPPASDTCHDEPNLTERCGCKYCHVAVEPSAAYWGRWAEAGAAPLDESTYPSYRADCATAAGARSAVCRRLYLTAAGHPDEQPYVGWLRAYVFADAERQANIAAGPAGIARQAVDSGAFASCAVKQMWEHFMAREAVDSDAEVLTELTARFSGSSHDLRDLIAAIVSRPEYVLAGRFGEVSP